MLESQDLQAIAELINKSAETINKRVDEKIDESVAVTNKRIDELEESLLDEIRRTQTHLENKIDAVKQNVDELNRYYRITKLENDNTTLLLQMITDLKREVDILKQKIA